MVIWDRTSWRAMMRASSSIIMARSLWQSIHGELWMEM